MLGGSQLLVCVYGLSRSHPGGERQGGAEPRVIPKVLSLAPAEPGLVTEAGVSPRGYEQSPRVRGVLCGTRWYLAMASLGFPCQRCISSCL